MSAANLKEKIEKILEHLKSEVARLRTGRATPALVESLEVDYYGAKTQLKSLAAISCPEPRSIAIQPWDKNAVQPIEKAIQASSLGINPIVDRDVIRLVVPALTEERRKEMLKLLGRHLEDARINIRKAREESLREVDRRERAKEISEDEKFRQKNEIQKVVDEANKRIEDTGAGKEREITTI